MDKFPEDINLKTCINEIKKNQSSMITKTREDFCKEIRKATKSCQWAVTLVFADSLWAENRVIIATELIERFGSVGIKTGGKYSATSIASELGDIPKNIVELQIEFANKF